MVWNWLCVDTLVWTLTMHELRAQCQVVHLPHSIHHQIYYYKMAINFFFSKFWCSTHDPHMLHTRPTHNPNMLQTGSRIQKSNSTHHCCCCCTAVICVAIDHCCNDKSIGSDGGLLGIGGPEIVHSACVRVICFTGVHILSHLCWGDYNTQFEPLSCFPLCIHSHPTSQSLLFLLFSPHMLIWNLYVESSQSYW
jgi:hypothetical protein